MNRKLYRDQYHRVFGGVCSGLAEYFEMDVTVVRLLFVFTAFIMGVGFLPYFVLWVVIPRKDYVFNQPNFNNPTVDYTVPPQQPFTQSNTPPPQPGNPFGGKSNGGNPFGDGPMGHTPPKPKSHGGIIVGLVLIMIGAAVLIDNYDLFPDIDFANLWPVILVVVGGGLIISGQTRQPWEKHDWQNADKKENSTTDNASAKDNSSNDNPSATDNPTVES